MRLFAALPLPDHVRDHLVSALLPIRTAAGPALRWSDPDQWHITCAFYGEQPDGITDDLLAHIAAGVGTPFDLCLKGAGSFHDHNLWIGGGGEVSALHTLMAACALDDAPEHHRAHMTVARVTRTAARPRFSPSLTGEFVHALSVYSGPTWTVDEVHLIQSELGKGRSGGPLHTVVGNIFLV